MVRVRLGYKLVFSTSSTVSWPTSIKPLKGEEDLPVVGRKTLTFDAQRTFKQTVRACRRSQENLKAGPDHSFFRRACFSNGSVNVARLRSIVEGHAAEGFHAAVIVVDYADILAPENARVDRRHQFDDTWRALRAMSEDYHCLVVTATQANRESYKSRTTRGEHVSEDKRKRAHVTSLFTISATEEERGEGVCRLGIADWRNGRPLPPVYVAGCLALGQPAVRSCFIGKRKDG